MLENVGNYMSVGMGFGEVKMMVIAAITQVTLNVTKYACPHLTFML